MERGTIRWGGIDYQLLGDFYFIELKAAGIARDEWRGCLEGG